MVRQTPTVIDAMSRTAGTTWKTNSLAVGVIALGLSLVVASYLPFGSFATRCLWTEEDASRYDRITLEYHMSAYQSPARQGLTDSQMQSRHEQLRKEFESMRDRLTAAKERPHTWSQILRWTGSLLTLGGVAGHLAGRSQ